MKKLPWGGYCENATEESYIKIQINREHNFSNGMLSQLKCDEIEHKFET